jgi:O-antigen ligase
MSVVLKLYNNFKINNFFILKLFFYSFPIILLFPSGYITAHVSLLTITSLILIYKQNIKIKLIFVDYLIFLFFFFSIISTLKNITTLGNIIFIKSILDLRFAIFFLIVRNLLVNKIVELKLLSIITLISSILLSFDIFLQHLIGHDIFGFKPFEGRYNGFFEHEAIAGSYIQKHFFISLLSIFLFDFKKITKIFFITLIINILGLGTLLSLDRMPFIIFFFIIFMLFIFMKNFRIIFLSNLIVLILLFAGFFKNYEVVKLRYEYFNRDINFNKILGKTTINNIKSTENTNNQSSKNEKLFYGDYSKIYNAAYLVFVKNYIIGSGVKSFIYECIKLPQDKNIISCNNHPHNIYFEILVNLGLTGICIFIILLFFIIKEIFKSLLKKNINDIQKSTLILFLTFFIAELVPFRSFGSIFQTVNGSMFWFFLALLSGVNLPKSLIKK